MSDFELRILREIAGETPPSPWGAAVAEALVWLEANGYIAAGRLTEKGRAYLAGQSPEVPAL